MKNTLLVGLSLTLVLSCSRERKAASTPEPTNELVGTTWKWVYRQENNREIYATIKFKDGAELEVSGNDHLQGTEKLIQVYRYNYNDASKTITYALTERPFCEGVIAGDSLRVTCSIQRVFKKVL